MGSGTYVPLYQLSGAPALGRINKANMINFFDGEEEKKDEMEEGEGETPAAMMTDGEEPAEEEEVGGEVA